MSEKLMFLMGFIEEDDDLDSLILQLIQKYQNISYDKIKYNFMFTNQIRLNKRLKMLVKRDLLKKTIIKDVIIYEVVRE